MVLINRASKAGKLTKSDCEVLINPTASETIQITLKGNTSKLFGEQMKAVILQTLSQYGIEKGVAVIVNEDGPLDYVIRARLECAIQRATQKEAENE